MRRGTASARGAAARSGTAAGSARATGPRAARCRRRGSPGLARFSVSPTGTASSPPAGSRPARSSSRLRSSRCRQGRAASCTSTRSLSRASPARRSSACATDSSRRAPPMQLTTRASRASGRRANRRSPAATATTIPQIERSASSAPMDQESTARPCTLRYCLGVAAPNRSPRPAAGRTAQRRAAPVIAPRPGLSAAGSVPRARWTLPAARPGRRSRSRRSCRDRCGHAPRAPHGRP